ncbi:MAG: hypothetical protein ACKV2V_13535 [Blastocatellia bacterium]
MELPDRETVRRMVAESLRQAGVRGEPAAPAAALHPSHGKFNVPEATESGGGAELLELVVSQMCSMEKGRTCDHCGVCQTMGF